MKLSLIVLPAILATTVFANENIAPTFSPNTFTQTGDVRDGHYVGQGLWNSLSQSGNYKTETTVSGITVTSTATLPNGEQKTWTFDKSDLSQGFFEVKVSGNVLGQGYCLEKVDVCHYEIRTANGDFSMEETLTFMPAQCVQNNCQPAKLYRFGSKTQGGVKIVWQERLDKE